MGVNLVRRPTYIVREDEEPGEGGRGEFLSSEKTKNGP